MRQSGRLSQMGGQMNEEERKPARKRRVAGARAIRRSKSPGAEELRRAANKALATNCEAISKRLTSNSAQGNVQSVKFLYELAQLSEDRGEGEGARKFRSMASKWAAEPQWSRDQCEGDSEPEDIRESESQLQHDA